MSSVIDLTSDSDVSNKCSFVVHGNPKPLPRMRHFRRGFFNPAKEDMIRFGEAVKRQVPVSQHGVLFPKHIGVTVKVTFHMRRPNSDFVGCSRLNRTLKRVALQLRKPFGPDIDNLSKFVLDVLGGIIYEDDKQVICLMATKKKDVDGYCEGKTIVEVSEHHW